MSTHKLLHFIRRMFLYKKHFVIISNNCWGGIMYQKFGMKYESPTVGLIIPPDDYNKFINRLDYYLTKTVEELKIENAKHIDLFSNLEKIHGSLVYGKVDDIEICFLHYRTFDIAKTKWERRITRFSDNVIFKNNDNNNMSENDYREWNDFAANHGSIFISCNRQWVNDSKATISIFCDDRLEGFHTAVSEKKVLNNCKPVLVINRLLKRKH